MMADWDRRYPGRTEVGIHRLANVVLSHPADDGLFDFKGLHASVPRWTKWTAAIPPSTARSSAPSCRCRPWPRCRSSRRPRRCAGEQRQCSAFGRVAAVTGSVRRSTRRARRRRGATFRRALYQAYGARRRSCRRPPGGQRWRRVDRGFRQAGSGLSGGARNAAESPSCRLWRRSGRRYAVGFAHGACDDDQGRRCVGDAVGLAAQLAGLRRSLARP